MTEDQIVMIHHDPRPYYIGHDSGYTIVVLAWEFMSGRLGIVPIPDAIPGLRP